MHKPHITCIRDASRYASQMLELQMLEMGLDVDTASTVIYSHMHSV